ncbi:MAG TPA: hypothetical protein RMH99_29205 [Sandaracinaceae bacterium LLY-WYZ-13_1]|nr:hypothetical protein [Sandaracinaceae bacterium LLY-WYZ-13_1]
MKHSTRYGTRTAAVLVAALAVVACGDMAMETMGDAMVEAADAMAGADAAMAQPPLAGCQSCDRAFTDIATVQVTASDEYYSLGEPFDVSGHDVIHVARDVESSNNSFDVLAQFGDRWVIIEEVSSGDDRVRSYDVIADRYRIRGASLDAGRPLIFAVRGERRPE